MHARLRVQGDDGVSAYQAGADVRRDSEWLRRMLVNGLAEPLDGEARTLIASGDNKWRYRSEALMRRARELGLQDRDIPAATLGA